MAPGGPAWEDQPSQQYSCEVYRYPYQFCGVDTSSWFKWYHFLHYWSLLCMLEKISYRCKWTRESDTDTHKFTHFFASYKCHSPDASSMCTDRRFQPWAPCRCKPDKTGPVHHALRQPGVQLDELILKTDTEYTEYTDTFWRLRHLWNCPEYWSMDRDGLWKLTPAERVNLVHSHKQHAQQSISIVTVALL